MLDLVGRLLGERYDVLELLGAGGMGAVYRAHDRELDELVALKLIHAQLAASPRIVERFRSEVKLARRVTHRNVARTFELVHAQGLMFCTMELIDGESLRARLQRDSRLPPGLAAWIASEACAGLAAAHAVGVVHRDIKPDNILLAADGRVVLADFGVAVTGVDNHAGDLSGTPAYMAPEQALGEPATAGADVYALGVVLYEMLCGQPAFVGTTYEVLVAKRDPDLAPVVIEGVEPELARAIARATTPDPAQRFASAAELAAALAPVIAATTGASTVALPPGLGTGSLELDTVIVLAPRGDAGQLHLAEGVRERLLDRLARRPRVRVLPRVAATAADATATVIELVAGDALVVAITRGGATRRLVVPLAIDELDAAGELITTAVGAGLDRAAPDAAIDAARELQLRAVVVGRKGIAGAVEAFSLAERARQLCPDDPRIVAAHALAYVRRAIANPTVDIDAATMVVRTALAIAPTRAETHVAAGHLELHTGEAPRAAAHYRAAIACSPFVPDGHDGLGRLLLEAGCFDQAMARIDDALAIAPDLIAVRWDVARAYALEGQWDAHDRIVAELGDVDRPPVRFRSAWWRGDRATMTALRAQPERFTRFEPAMFARLFAVALDGAWREQRDALIDVVEGTIRARRRQATVAQFVVEAAGAAGDVEVCERLLAHALDHGLYDLHWLDRCPLLEVARASPRFARTRARVERRADAILDALYGDHEAETALA